MWPFRRRADGGPPVGPPAEPSGPPGAPAVHRGEWRSLPPIQRLVTPPSGTFGTASFESGLTSRQPTGVLGQLGHFVASDAPGGTVAGFARPPVGRAFAPPPGGAWTADGEAAAGGEAGPEPTEVAPVRPRPPTRDLVRAPALPSTPVVARAVAVAQPTPEVVPVVRAPKEEAVVATPDPEPVAAAAAVEPEPVPAVATDPVVEPQTTPREPPSPPVVPTLAAPPARRRLGLGPPLPAPRAPGGGGALPSAPRSSAAAAVSLPRGPASLQRRATAPASGATPAAPPPASPHGPPTAPAVGGSPVPGLPHPASGPTGAPAGDPGPAVTPEVSQVVAAILSTGPGEPWPNAPLVGDLPLVATRAEPAAADGPPVGGDAPVAVQRRAPSLVTAPDPYSQPGGGHRAPSGTVPAALAVSPDETLPVAPLAAERSLVARRRGSVPRGSSPASPVATPTTTVPPVQRTLGSPAPAPTPAPAPAATAAPSTGTGAREPVPSGWVDAGAVAVAAGLGHRAPDGSVVFGLLPASTGGFRPPPSATVQRAEDEGTPPAQEPAPAGASAPPSTTVTAPAPPAEAPAPAAGGATPGAAGATLTDRDVDRLARRLYPRLRDHLRGELRLDRERLGRATDLGSRN